MAKKTVKLLFFCIPIFLIFRNWFIFPFLSAPDFPYFFTETLADYRLFPPVWAPTLGIGLGGEMINQGLGTFIYLIVSLFVNRLGMPWEVVYKVFIFGLFLLLSVFSSSYLLRTVIGKPTKIQYFLSVLLFTANTYILMVVDGGQVGVALAYSMSPLVLAMFVGLVSRISNIQFPIIVGLVSAIQIMFDLRVAVLTLAISLAYGLYHYVFVKRYNFMHYVLGLFVAAVIVIGLHAHWLLPVVFFRSHPAQVMVRDFNFGSLESFRFFSFATFSQTLALLHPNWPENIFGKVYFMRPEFLALPFLAFLSLLFFRGPKFFVLLALIGAFLAKGANPPFSEINTWLFIHVPFSSLFRDPTKFYLLTVLSYIILIPYSTHVLMEWVYKKVKPKSVRSVILFVPILYILFLLRPIFLNELNGTFSRHEIPNEYDSLKNFLVNQSDFSRTLWIPKQQRFNYYSYTHPALSANRLFNATSSAEIIGKLQEKNTREFLSTISVQYIIVPYDSFGEIFVRDRKYDETQYNDIVAALDAIPWLQKLEGFGSISVYKTSVAKDHIWLDGEGALKYSQLSPSMYKVHVSANNRSQVIFTDVFSPYWIADTGDEALQSQKTADNLNSFPIVKEGTYVLTVYFSKQKYFMYGRIITFVFIFLLLFVPIYRIIKRIYDKSHRRNN